MAAPAQFTELLKTGEIRLLTIIKFDSSPHYYVSTGGNIPGLVPKDSGEIRPWLLEDIEWPSQSFDETEWKTSTQGIDFALVDVGGAISTLIAVDTGLGIFEDFVEVWLLPEHPEAKFGRDSVKFGRFTVDYDIAYQIIGSVADVPHLPMLKTTDAQETVGMYKFSTSSMLALLEAPIDIQEGRCENRDDLNATGNSVQGDTVVRHLAFMPKVSSDQNLVTDEGFESGGMTNWTTVSGSPTASTSRPLKGAYAMRNTSSFEVEQIVKNSGVAVGQKYFGGAWSISDTRDITPPDTCFWTGTITLEGLDSGGSVVESEFVAATFLTTTWHSSNVVEYTVADPDVVSIRISIAGTLNEAGTGCGVANNLDIDEVWVTSCVRYCLLRREIMSYIDIIVDIGTGSNDGTRLAMVKRSRFNTPEEPSQDGDEILHCAVFEDHPLKILLQMLCFSDQGGNSNQIGCGFSLGLDHRIVDLDGIAALFDSSTEPYDGFADITFSFRRTEPIESVKEYIEEHILKPIAARFYVTQSGKISVKVFRDPRNPSHTIGREDILGMPKYSIDYDSIVNVIDWKFDYDSAGVVDNEKDSKYLQEITYDESNFGDQSTPSQDLFEEKKLEIESEGLRGYESAAMGLSLDLNGNEIAYNTSRLLLERMQQPRPKYVVEVSSYLAADMAIGDDVAFSHPALPDSRTGAVGIKNVPCELTAWKPNRNNQSASLELSRLYVSGGFQAMGFATPPTASASDFVIDDSGTQLDVTQLSDLGLKNYPEGNCRPVTIWHNTGSVLRDRPTFSGWFHTEVHASDTMGFTPDDSTVVGFLDDTRDFMAFVWPNDDTTIYIVYRHVNKAYEKGDFSGETSHTIAVVDMATRFSGRKSVRQRVTTTKFFRYK